MFSLVFAAANTRLLLNSYLSRIGNIENASCRACGHPSQDTSHLILHCAATDFSRRSLFGNSVSPRPLVQALKSFPASGAPWSSTKFPFFGRVTTTIVLLESTFQKWPLCAERTPFTTPLPLRTCFCISYFGYFFDGQMVVKFGIIVPKTVTSPMLKINFFCS